MTVEWIKNNFKSFVIAIFILAGWASFNANKSYEYLEKLEKFQDFKMNEMEKLSKRELKIKEDELRLQASINGTERKIQEAETLKRQAESLMEEAHQKQSQLAEAENSVSQKKQQLSDEADIKRLMSEVSALGVNLRAAPPCENPDLMAQYSRGVSLIREISQRVRSANLSSQYQAYISSNSLWISSDDCTSKEARVHAR